MKYAMSFLLLLFFINLSAQDYWVNEYELGNRDQEIGRNVIALDSLIVVTSGITCASNTKLCHKFSVYDMMGNLLYVTTYDSLIHLRGAIPDRGLVMRDDRFITCGKSFRSDTEFCIIAQNIEGEVVQRKFITNPYDSTQRIEPQVLLELGDYLVLVADIFEITDAPPYGFINRVAAYTIDPLTFEIINEFTYEPTEYLVDVKDVKITADNHVILGVNQRIDAPIGNGDRHILQFIKLNSSMTMVDSMSAEMISISNEDRFAIGHDNRIVATRKESREELWIYDLETKTVEKKSYDPFTDQNRGKIHYDIRGIKADRNGDIYLYGRLNSLRLNYTFSGYIQKLDENYEVVKERIYITHANDAVGFEGRDGWSDYSVVYDMYFDDNDNVYFTGYVDDVYRDAGSTKPNSNILLGKLDLELCATDSCEVEHYVGGHLRPDHLALPNKTWHIYNETTQEVYRYRLSASSVYMADRYYLELLRSDTYDGDEFYSTGQYLRERTNQVYLRKDEEDFFLYDFDMEQDSRMSSWVYERFEANHQMVEFDSIQLENGEMARRTKLRCSIDEDAEDYGYYYWIEGVGDTKGLLAIGEACIEGRASHLLCAYDGDGNMIWDNPDFAGCWVTVSTEDELSDLSVITPNPTTGLINIKGYRGYDKIIIHSMIGQVVMEEDSRLELDISSLNSGSYIITLKGRTQSHTQKIIKL